MGKRCIVGGCSNTHKEKVSLHVFPKEQKYRKLWTAAVKRSRKHWNGPTKDSVICSTHLTEESYVSLNPLYEQLVLGKPKTRSLRPDAVPSIFGERTPTSGGVHDRPGSTGRPTARAVVAKMDRKRISEEALREVQEPTAKVQRQTSPVAPGPVITVIADVGTQCDLVPLPPLNSSTASNQPEPSGGGPTEVPKCAGSNAVASSVSREDPSASPEYAPSSHSSSDETSSADDSSREQVPEHHDRFFLIQESCLLSLFKTCSECRGRVDADVSRIQGSMIRVSEVCRDCRGLEVWESQTSLSGMPYGNLRLSAAILFTGARPFKALRIFDAMRCPVQTVRTFTTHQRLWLHPVIQHVWSRRQEDMLTGLKEIGTPLNIGGDGRSDSPGHSAKYGSYTFVDLQWNMVLHQELVQSNEVSSSNAMELEGLKRGLDFLGRNGVAIDGLEGGVSKKLQMVAKKKSCAVVGPWTKSISNHLYWVAASSSTDSEEVILAKWLSVANHIQNIHSHESQLFSECLHGDLSTSGRQKKWLKPSTEACEKAVEILTNTALQRDIKKLSTLYQTSDVEGFHAVIIHFAPKMTHFSYRGMKSRLLLAALHFNENANRPQAKRRDGMERFTVKSPKYKKGGATVCKVPTEATYGYLGELMACLVEFCRSGTLGEKPPAAVADDPPPLAASYVRPDKEEAIRAHQSRFQKE